MYIGLASTMYIHTYIFGVYTVFLAGYPPSIRCIHTILANLIYMVLANTGYMCPMRFCRVIVFPANFTGYRQTVTHTLCRATNLPVKRAQTECAYIIHHAHTHTHTHAHTHTHTHTHKHTHTHTYTHTMHTPNSMHYTNREHASYMCW